MTTAKISEEGKLVSLGNELRALKGMHEQLSVKYEDTAKQLQRVQEDCAVEKSARINAEKASDQVRVKRVAWAPGLGINASSAGIGESQRSDGRACDFAETVDGNGGTAERGKFGLCQVEKGRGRVEESAGLSPRGLGVL